MIRTGKAGNGSYGIVYTGETIEKRQQIAVKRNIIDSSVNFCGSLKELDLLNKLRGHPYIVKILKVSFGCPFDKPNSPISKKMSDCKEDYLHFVFEKAEKNGFDLIYDSNTDVSFLKLAMVQLLLGVEFMHSRKIIHRDIKPSNLLYFPGKTHKEQGTVKICDFGLSKIHTNQAPNSPNIVTCWYRAPEICSKREYSYSSDIWSVGCVLFEMISKRAFLYGYPDNDSQILSKIIGLMPSPDLEDIKEITNDYNFKLTNEASPRKRKSFREMINLSNKEIKEFNSSDCTYDNFIDLLDKLLVLNPNKRLTATEALNHPFFSSYKNYIDKIRKKYPPTPFIENINISKCYEREWACKIAFIIFNGRSGIKWYSHRIIFQSIDIFDRYLEFLHTTKRKEAIENKNEAINNKGSLLTRYQTELRYLVCLYMSIKYFTPMFCTIPYYKLASKEYRTDKAMIEAENFEKFLLKDVLKFNIYRDTVFESADIYNDSLDEYSIRDLLLSYGTVNSINMPAKKLYYNLRSKVTK